MQAGGRRDASHAAVLGCVAACLGMVFVVSWDGTPHFFQQLFGPSVMMGCGKGFVNPAAGTVPGLWEFIHPDWHAVTPPELDCFDCGQVPEAVETTPMPSFQRRQRYLLMAAGAAWRVLGVCWSALTPLYGLLFGAAAAVLYGLFRLALPRAGAWVAVMLLITSPVQLNNLVRLRDYSKAPFILAAILIMAWLVARPFARGRVFAASALCGAVLGVGIGFRMDALICVPAFCLVALCFVEGAPWTRLREKSAALVLFLAVFTVTGWPILGAMGTSMKYQDFMLGLNDLYDGRLGVGGVPYQVNHRYFDREPFATLEAHHVGRTGEPAHFDWDTPEVEAEGRRYTHAVLRTFPADIVLRALAATLRTVDELRASPAHPVPRGIDDAVLRQAFEARGQVVSLALRYARYAVVLALLIIAARSLRLGLAALFLLLWFGGYGAVQFASRHYFHMQWLSFWAVAVCLAAAGWAALWAWRKGRGQDPGFVLLPHGVKGSLWRAGVFAIVGAAGLGLPLAGLRAYQGGQVRQVLAAYEAAPRTPVATRTLPAHEGGDRLLLAAVDAAPLPKVSPFFDFDYFVVEFDTSAGDIPFVARYDGSAFDTRLNWSGTLPQSADGPVRLYFPAYYARWYNTNGAWSQFLGLEVAAGDAGCLRGLARVDHPEDFTFLLTATLAPGWEERPLYQRLTR